MEEIIIDVFQKLFLRKMNTVRKNMFDGDVLKRRIIFIYLNIYIKYRNHFLKLCIPRLMRDNTCIQLII